MKTVMFFLIVLICCAQLNAQGPIDGYMKGKGNLDLAFSVSRNTASTFLGAEGKAYDEPFKGSLVSVFAEYGITEHLDVVATLPYVLTADQKGLQDGSLHLKFRPLRKEMKKIGTLNVIGAAGISAPLSDYAPLAAGAIGQRATVFQPRLVLQLDSKLGPFFNVMAGYNVRLDELKEEDIASIKLTRPDYVAESPKDYTSLLFKVGLPAARYYLDAWVEQQITKGGADFVQNVKDLPQAYGVSYTQIGGTAYYSEKGKAGVYISSGLILAGRNTSKVLRLTAGVVVKL